ncbi:MAG: hypothetical protein HIU57_08615 [Acidobacteria bacterium]|nr:hypothetical protein [Acidobacteriota bacterium]
MFIGSLDAWDAAVADVTSRSRVCVLATAAAFRGPREAIEQIRELLGPRDVSVVGVSAVDRASANDPSVVAELAASDLVVLCDGAPLHARSVWRHSSLGEALVRANLLCVGATGSVLGATMIDPRGGAPTTGLGLFADVVLSVPTSAPQSKRTRELLAHETLVELGPHAAVAYDGHWSVLDDRDLMVTRAGVDGDLRLGDGQ